MKRRLLAALAFAVAFGAAHAQDKGLEKAIFAGGCFWCMESDFDKLPGVVSTTSGYTGGHTAHPTYHQVSAGDTGHAESVEVLFDPKVVSYPQLLDYYWHSIDPTVKNRQFCDVGTQYPPRSSTWMRSKSASPRRRRRRSCAPSRSRRRS